MDVLDATKSCLVRHNQSVGVLIAFIVNGTLCTYKVYHNILLIVFGVDKSDAVEMTVCCCLIRLTPMHLVYAPGFARLQSYIQPAIQFEMFP